MFTTMKLIVYKIILFSLELFRLSIYYSCIPFIPLIKQHFEETMKSNGITVNGPGKNDIQVNDNRMFQLIASSPLAGFIEAYVKSYFDCDDLLKFFSATMNTKMFLYSLFHPYNYIKSDLLHYLRLHNESNAYETGGKGYDKYIEIIEKYFTGDYQNASCPYFRGAETLKEAVENMRNLIVRKLKLKPKMRVLDIGCGFGGLAKYLADNHDVHVVGITNSKEMANKARKHCANNENIEIHCMDFRNMSQLGSFDRIVCVEMVEHIGIFNFNIFSNLVRESLTSDGLFLLHVSGYNNPHLPNGNMLTQYLNFGFILLPNLNQIVKYTESLFVMEDWQNYGNHYAIGFKKVFERNEKMKERIINEEGYEFYRSMQLLIATSSSAFANQIAQVWHIVLSKNGLIGGYNSEH